MEAERCEGERKKKIVDLIGIINKLKALNPIPVKLETDQVEEAKAPEIPKETLEKGNFYVALQNYLQH